MIPILLALQAIPLPLPAGPAVAPSGWASPQVLMTLGTVLVTVIGALTTAVIQVLRELRSTKTEIKETKQLVASNAEMGAAVGEHRDKKLDRIELLVNGRYGEVLQELATLRKTVASHTGTAQDKALADAAQVRATDQVQRVATLIATTPTKPPTP